MVLCEFQFGHTKDRFERSLARRFPVVDYNHCICLEVVSRENRPGYCLKNRLERVVQKRFRRLGL